MEKYKIMECLEKLTVSEYRIAIKLLPQIIGKSQNTFWNYVRVEAGSKMGLPYTVVVTLEKFFKLQPDELINVPIESPGYDQVIAQYRKEQMGSFSCSDPRINQLQQNIIWSMKSNFVDIPTDCPQHD